METSFRIGLLDSRALQEPQDLSPAWISSDSGHYNAVMDLITAYGFDAAHRIAGHS
jgi:hypothetical protein